ncbi:MAG TPA: DUF805 domain-containing protein [Stellaceae bacterium]|nr:DUF805 domain-containing protein [Stellaceae bacterium]
MKGNVIGFDPDTNTGAISGHDGNRYDFATADWRAHSPPRHGDVVDFQPEGRRAAQIYLVQAEYVPPSFGAFYFSPSGRISRSQFWLRAILPIWGIWTILYIITVSMAIGESTVGAGIFGFLLVIYTLVIIWPAFATYIKRIHDRNKSAWFILIPLIPGVLLSIVWSVALIGAVSSIATGSQAGVGVLVGAGAFTWILLLVHIGVSIWFFVEFGCLRGTIGDNRFGPDPVHQ